MDVKSALRIYTALGFNSWYFAESLAEHGGVDGLVDWLLTRVAWRSHVRLPHCPVCTAPLMYDGSYLTRETMFQRAAMVCPHGHGEFDADSQDTLVAIPAR